MPHVDLALRDKNFRLVNLNGDGSRKKDNHADIGGFRHERDAFFAWANEHNLTAACRGKATLKPAVGLLP